MKSFLMFCLYLCVAISTVKSATYYYRAGREGREIIVPLINEEVQPQIVELKKDPLVVIDEVVAVPAENEQSVAAAEIVEKTPEQAVRLANVEPEPLREIEVAKIADAFADEARRIPAPSVEKIESLEIVPPPNAPLKSGTISETIKAAVIEAVESTPIEAPAEAPVEVPVEAPIEATKSIPIEEPVEAVKSTPVEVAPVAATIVTDEKPAAVETVPAEIAVVPEVKSTAVEAIPVNEIVVPVEKAAEEVVSAVVIESEPQAKEAPTEEIDPVVRQTVNPPNPPSAPSGIQAFIEPFQAAIQNALNNNPIQGALSAFGINRPISGAAQADAQAESPVVEAVTSVAPTSPSGPAAFFQQVSNTITNILRPSATAATVPAAPATAIENEIKGGDTSVQVIQHSNDVNDKVDLAKSAEKVE